MFSALRKLTAGTNKNEVNGRSPTGGHQTMHASLQKKFAKGVHYNMKIILRGDRNVGKSCLFHRLQGKGFIDEYNPTQEIQVTSIQWSYKATDDIVKVEIWDVVDKGKKKKPLEGLKLNTCPTTLYEEPALDAEFLDVYKGTHGVIMMLDITKQWTFDYVKRELPKVPPTIPVMVLANHRDMGHHRCVSEDDVKFFIESLNRGPSDAQIRFGESSMRNSFGLKLLHKFFNLPFLALQRDSLLKQLETNGQEMALTNEELDLYLETDDASYDRFLELLTQKRRLTADALSTATVSNAIQAPAYNAPLTNAPKQLPANQVQAATAKVEATKPPLEQSVKPIVITPIAANDSTVKKDNTYSSVEDFVVDGEDGDVALGFLSSVDETPSEPIESGVGQESDSDAEKEGNPMVMSFQDEIDDEDLLRPSQHSNLVAQISDSSDEELEASQPDRPVVVYTVNQTLEDLNTEENLDDWLNGGSKVLTTSKSKTATSSNVPVKVKTDEDMPTVGSFNIESISDNSAEEIQTEVTSKTIRKTKEKKSKRKSKKASKETGRSLNSSSIETATIEKSRPHEEYEEI